MLTDVPSCAKAAKRNAASKNTVKIKEPSFIIPLSYYVTQINQVLDADARVLRNQEP
jgi:hypothetical protein